MAALSSAPPLAPEPAPIGGEQAGGKEGGRTVLPLLVAAVLLLGLLPRLQRLGGVSVWFDEAFSRKMATFGFAEIWRRTAADNNPPLYYWLLKAWAGAFGDSPESLRSLSVLSGTLAVLGAFLLVREAGRRPGSTPVVGRPSPADGAALLAAALVALSPLQIAWSLQARMYAPGAALAAFSSWALLRALRPGPPRFAAWAGYVVLAAALAYTHIFALFTLAAQGLFAAGVGLRRGLAKSPDGWRTLGAAFVAFFAVELCWLPWAGVFLAQIDRVAAGFWIPPFRWGQPFEVAYQFFCVPERDSSTSPALGYAAAAACLAVTAGLLLFGRPGHRLIALGFGVPVAAALLVSVFLQNVFVTHYFLLAHVFLPCGIAVAATHVPTAPGKALASAAAFLAASVMCWRHVEAREERARVPGLKAAADYLDVIRRPGEPVLTGNPMLYAAVLTHVGDRDGTYVVGQGGDFPFFQGTAVMREAEYLDAGRLPAAHAARAWVVEGVNWNGGTWTVAMPEPWVPAQEVRFPELYGADCAIVVRRYERLDALSAPRQARSPIASGRPLEARSNEVPDAVSRGSEQPREDS